jgi:hypothetical protein
VTSAALIARQCTVLPLLLTHLPLVLAPARPRLQTELLARLEANPGAGVTSQDLEIATQRALEQAV